MAVERRLAQAPFRHPADSAVAHTLHQEVAQWFLKTDRRAAHPLAGAGVGLQALAAGEGEVVELAVAEGVARLAPRAEPMIHLFIKAEGRSRLRMAGDD